MLVKRGFLVAIKNHQTVCLSWVRWGILKMFEVSSDEFLSFHSPTTLSKLPRSLKPPPLHYTTTTVDPYTRHHTITPHYYTLAPIQHNTTSHHITSYHTTTHYTPPHQTTPHHITLNQTTPHLYSQFYHHYWCQQLWSSFRSPPQTGFYPARWEFVVALRRLWSRLWWWWIGWLVSGLAGGWWVGWWVIGGGWVDW